MKTRKHRSVIGIFGLLFEQVRRHEIGLKQGRFDVNQRHDQNTDRFEELLAEFIGLGKQAAILKSDRKSFEAATLLMLRSRASIVIDQLLACCRHMDRYDERRRFLAITLIFTSARRIDLLGFDLLHLLDEILPT